MSDPAKSPRIEMFGAFLQNGNTILLLQQMMQEMMTKTPSDPLKFMKDYLEQCIESKENRVVAHEDLGGWPVHITELTPTAEKELDKLRRENRRLRLCVNKDAGAVLIECSRLENALDACKDEIKLLTKELNEVKK